MALQLTSLKLRRAFWILFDARHWRTRANLDWGSARGKEVNTTKTNADTIIAMLQL